jgi:hypothetical protein
MMSMIILVHGLVKHLLQMDDRSSQHIVAFTKHVVNFYRKQTKEKVRFVRLLS